MKIILPSAGILGTKTVNMRAPKFGDLREMHNTNQIDELVKIEFVKRLIDEHTDLSKITKDDVEYLFTIAAFALEFNVMSYDVVCPKDGTTISSDFTFSDKEIVMLDKKGYPFSKVIGETKYTWHLLSAQNYIDAIEYALTQDDFDPALEDAQVAFILGYSLDEIDKVKQLPPSIYLSAFLFQRTLFHGVPLEQIVTCPSCGAKIKVNLKASADMVKVDIPSLMRYYKHISDRTSFEAFLDLTFPEYKSFIDELNSKLNG